MRAGTVVMILASLCLTPSSLLAQEEGPPERTLMGRVVDANTGTPLLGAFVHLQGQGRGVLTGEEGTFSLSGLPAGSLSVAVEHLGYDELVQGVQNTEGEHPIVFGLTPDPILLEGLEIVLHRFEGRRGAYPHAIQLLERRDLLTTAALDVVDLIRLRSFLNPIPCPGTMMEPTCSVIRGRIRPIKVYVDEMPFWGGMDFLRTVPPHHLHMVEILSARGQVRVYTEWYMKQLGARPAALAPYGW